MSRPTPDPSFLDEMVALETSYLEGADEIERSGFGGGPARWESERRPLTDAIERDGSFLDVGCANGRLAADVVRWSAARGVTVEPFGIDLGRALVAEAHKLHPAREGNFVVADAWAWQPPRRFTYVYSLLDLSPDDMIKSWIERLASWVEPEGRLILGSYGSCSRSLAPQDPGVALAAAGLTPVGRSRGGEGPTTRFAWSHCPA